MEGRRKGGGDHKSAKAKDRSAGNSREAKRAPETRDVAAAATGHSEKTLRGGRWAAETVRKVLAQDLTRPREEEVSPASGSLLSPRITHLGRS